MKILLVVPEYPPFSIGGGASVYLNLALNYKKSGHQVTVVYGFYPSRSVFEKVRRFKKDGITFYQVPELPTPSFAPDLKIRMPISPYIYGRLGQIFKQIDPDVAHLHGYGFLFIDLNARILKKLGILYILTVHGWPIKHLQSSMLIKSVFNFYLKTWADKTLKDARAISCVSSFLKKQLPKKYQDKTSVIYNGFDFSIKKLAQKIDIREKHRIDKDTKIVMSLGRVAWIKGYQEFIERIPDLEKKGVKVRYLIAGDDEGYKKDLVDLISQLNLESSVEFIGFLDETARDQYLEQVDFLAIPSLIEGFGLAGLEGVNFGKPILVGKAKAVQEVLAGYSQTRSIYDKNLAKFMQQSFFKNDKNLAKFMQQSFFKNDKNFDKKKFGYQRITKEYLALLEKVKK